LAACQRKRLRFLRFSFTQRTQRKRLRLNGNRALSTVTCFVTRFVISLSPFCLGCWRFALSAAVAAADAAFSILMFSNQIKSNQQLT